jgi:hypothetical protein
MLFIVDGATVEWEATHHIGAPRFAKTPFVGPPAKTSVGVVEGFTIGSFPSANAV